MTQNQGAGRNPKKFTKSIELINPHPSLQVENVSRAFSSMSRFFSSKVVLGKNVTELLKDQGKMITQVQCVCVWRHQELKGGEPRRFSPGAARLEAFLGSDWHPYPTQS